MNTTKTETLTIGDTTMTNCPVEHANQIRANIAAGLPFPMETDIEHSLAMSVFLTDEQRLAVRAEPDDLKKRLLVQEFVDAFIAEGDRT